MTFTIRQWGLAFVLVLGFCSSFYLRQQIAQARAANGEVSDRWIPEVARANEFQAAVLKFRNQQYMFVTAQGEAKRQLEKLLDEEAQGITIQKKMIESKVRGNEERVLYDAVSASWDEYAKVHDRFAMAVKAGNREVASTILTQDGGPAFRKLENAIANFGAETYSVTHSISFAANASITHVQRFAEFLMGVNFILGALFGFAVYRRRRDRKAAGTGQGGPTSGGQDGGDKVVPFKKAA